MKYNRTFYITFILLFSLSLYGVFLMNSYLILFSNIALTTSFIIIFKVQENLTSRNLSNILIINFLSFMICESLGFFGDDIVYFFLTYFFGLIAAVTSFVFLNTNSGWRKKALSRRNKLYSLPIIIFLFYIVDKFVLPSFPDVVFFPATIAIILLIVTFVIAFFRETNKKSYYFIIIACALFIIALMFTANLSTLNNAHNPLIVLTYFFYLTAKFFWVQGCIWSLKSSS